MATPLSENFKKAKDIISDDVFSKLEKDIHKLNSRLIIPFVRTNYENDDTLQKKIQKEVTLSMEDTFDIIKFIMAMESKFTNPSPNMLENTPVGEINIENLLHSFVYFMVMLIVIPLLQRMEQLDRDEILIRQNAKIFANLPQRFHNVIKKCMFTKSIDEFNKFINNTDKYIKDGKLTAEEFVEHSPKTYATHKKKYEFYQEFISHFK